MKTWAMKMPYMDQLSHFGKVKPLGYDLKKPGIYHVFRYLPRCLIIIWWTCTWTFICQWYPIFSYTVWDYQFLFGTNVQRSWKEIIFPRSRCGTIIVWILWLLYSIIQCRWWVWDYVKNINTYYITHMWRWW